MTIVDDMPVLLKLTGQVSQLLFFQFSSDFIP